MSEASSTLSDKERTMALDAMRAALNAVDCYLALMVQKKDLKAIKGLNEVRWNLLGAIDQLRSNDWVFLNRFVGLTYGDAGTLAQSRHFRLLVESIDGKSCTTPADCDPNRICVEIVNDRVSKVIGVR